MHQCTVLRKDKIVINDAIIASNICWDSKISQQCCSLTCTPCLIRTTALFRPHRNTTYIDVACCYRWSSVVCLCRSVTFVSAAKMAKPIEIPFWLWNQVGPRNQILDGVQIPACEGAILRRKGRPIVNYRILCCELCKNGWADWDAVWDVDSGRPREPCSRWVSRSPNDSGQC